MRDGVFDGEEGTTHVNILGLVPFFGGDVLDGGKYPVDAGVGHDDVEAAPPLDGCRDEGFDVLGIGYVAGQGQRFAAHSFDFIDGFLAALCSACGERYFRSFARHGHGCRSADTTTAACYQRYFVLELHIDYLTSIGVDEKMRGEYSLESVY